MLPVANMLCALGFAVSFPFLPLMVRGLGVTENLGPWVGTMMFVFFTVSFAANPVWGSIADHFSRKLMVLRAMLGMGVMMSLVPLAPSPLAFAAMFCAIGLFNGFTPAGMSLLVANTPPRKIGSVLSYAQTGNLVGQTMGPALGTLLAGFMAHHHSMFSVSGGLLFCGGLLVLFFVHEVRQPAPGPWRLDWIGHLRDVLKAPRMGALFVVSFLFTMMWSGNVTIVTLFMLDLLAANPGTAGGETRWIGAAAMGLAFSSVIAMPLWARVIDRVGPARVMRWTGTAAIVTQLPLLVLDTPLALVLTRVVFGLSTVAIHPAVVQLIRMQAPKGMDARAISYATAFQFLAMGTAPFIAGMVAPLLGLRVYFAFTLCALGTGLWWWRRTAARTG